MESLEGWRQSIVPKVRSDRFENDLTPPRSFYVTRHSVCKLFFIAHLSEKHRESLELCFEVQLIDDFGHTLDSVVLGVNDENATVHGSEVPREVLKALLDLEIGDTGYVNELGIASYPGEQSNRPAMKGIFYVQHLNNDERGTVDSTEKPFLIALVNEYGQSVASGFVTRTDDSLMIDGNEVPLEVIKYAQNQALGRGEYVNAVGKVVSPGHWQSID